MMPNNWIKPLDKVLPHVEWNSTRKHLRSEWKPVRHSNTAHELHIILQGSCRVELVDREVEIKAGQGLIILPNTFHCCRSITKPFLRMTVNFIPQNQHLLTEPANGNKFFLFQTTQPIERTCHEIFEEAQKMSYCKIRVR